MFQDSHSTSSPYDSIPVGRRKEAPSSFLLRAKPRNCTNHVRSYLIGQDSITWPHLPAMESGNVVFCHVWLGEGILKGNLPFLPQMLTCLGNSRLHLSHSFFICKLLPSFIHVFILHIYVPGLWYKRHFWTTWLLTDPLTSWTISPGGQVRSVLLPAVPTASSAYRSLTYRSHIISCPQITNGWPFWLLCFVRTFLTQGLSSFTFQTFWLLFPLSPRAKHFSPYEVKCVLSQNPKSGIKHKWKCIKTRSPREMAFQGS